MLGEKKKNIKFLIENNIFQKILNLINIHRNQNKILMEIFLILNNCISFQDYEITKFIFCENLFYEIFSFLTTDQDIELVVISINLIENIIKCEKIFFEENSFLMSLNSDCIDKFYYRNMFHKFNGLYTLEFYKELLKNDNINEKINCIINDLNIN